MAHAITSSRPLSHRRARVGRFEAFRVNGTQVGTLIAESEVTSTGTAQDHTVIPTGSVVKSGTPLCISAIDNDAGQQTLFPFGTVHGYFAKDK